MGVAGVGFKQAAIVEITSVEADETSGTFDFNSYSRCRVGHQQAGIVNDGDFIEGDVAGDGRCEWRDLELCWRAGRMQFVGGDPFARAITDR